MRKHRRLMSFAAMMITAGTGADENQRADPDEIEEVIVVAESTTYSNNVVSLPMQEQQTPITSALAVIDNLPGVSIQEGDTYGFDDWSTTVSMRGFQISLADQQLGITIDGMPNGNSNYGGGAKANRFIDTANLAGVSVSQGTADVASRSNEALGGTLDFLSDDPRTERAFTAQLTRGEFSAERYYGRFDTGALFDSETYAWVSLSHQRASDWVNGSAENERDHIAAKVISTFGNVSWTAYVAYDDTHEDNYQRLFSAADFASNPDWDQLTDEWTGIPYIDQLYRRGWSTLRENLFGYVKAVLAMSDNFNAAIGFYHHDNSGRGDWVPPYLVDLTNESGATESETQSGRTIRGGGLLGRIFFVDGNGLRLDPIAGCESTLTFPYGGAGPQSDPVCHAGNAIGVQSYRHTHYGKERTGFTADFDWTVELDGMVNLVRGGVWIEDYLRTESRDWHKIMDTRVGFEFDAVPYWIQYSREYPVDIVKWHLEDTVILGPASVSMGIKQFLVDLERRDLFGDTADAAVDSDSDVLISGGLVLETPIEGIELFAGFSENFKAFSDLLLERPASDFSQLEPEMSENIDVGVRFNTDRFAGSLSFYDISFDNRIIFLDNQSVSGPNYVIGTDGTYFNAGGVESSGFEIAGTYRVTDSVSAYVAWTMNESEYIGSGDSLVDGELGITPGATVVNMPEDMFVISLDWENEFVRIGATAKFTGERYVDFSNTWLASDYALVDVYAAVNGEAISPAWSSVDARFTINNLLDESYLGGISSGGAWIGAPRTAAVTLSMDF